MWEAKLPSPLVPGPGAARVLAPPPATVQKAQLGGANCHPSAARMLAPMTAPMADAPTGALLRKLFAPRGLAPQPTTMAHAQPHRLEGSNCGLGAARVLTPWGSTGNSSGNNHASGLPYIQAALTTESIRNG